MNIIETTPPLQRLFTVELTEDEAHMLMALLARLSADSGYILPGYDKWRQLLGRCRYRVDNSSTTTAIILTKI